MLKELAGQVFVHSVFDCQFQCHREHREAVKAHPGCAVCLAKMAAAREWCTAVEDANVVESQKTTLEDVATVEILAVDPPGEIQDKLVKCAAKERSIGHAGNATFNL